MRKTKLSICITLLAFTNCTSWYLVVLQVKPLISTVEDILVSIQYLLIDPHVLTLIFEEMIINWAFIICKVTDCEWSCGTIWYGQLLWFIYLDIGSPMICFYPSCVFSIPSPRLGNRKRTTSWSKIIYNHKPWEILFLTCYNTIFSLRTKNTRHT